LFKTPQPVTVCGVFSLCALTLTPQFTMAACGVRSLRRRPLNSKIPVRKMNKLPSVKLSSSELAKQPSTKANK